MQRIKDLNLVHVRVGRPIEFPQRLELPPDVPNISTVLGAKHGVDGLPHLGSRGLPDHLLGDVRPDGAEKQPDHASTTWRTRGRGGDGGVTRTLGHGLRRQRRCAVEVAVKPALAKFDMVRERQSMKLLRPRWTWGAGIGTAVVAVGAETAGPRTVESWRAEEEDIPAGLQGSRQRQPRAPGGDGGGC